MSNPSDFVIENGVLTKYKGPGGDVVIPDGVTSIQWSVLKGCKTLTTLTIPDSVKQIGSEAFANCDCLKSITICGAVKSIGWGAFANCNELTAVSLLNIVNSFGSGVFQSSGRINYFFAPLISPKELEGCEQSIVATRTFLRKFQDYPNPIIVDEYVKYIASKKKKLLQDLLLADAVEVLKMLVAANKITKKNFEREFLQPALEFKAESCVNYLESVFGGTEKKESLNVAEKTLWDGIHFSEDGKQLLKYKEEPGRTEYHVPAGTKIIAAGAFIGTDLYGSDGRKKRFFSNVGTSLEKIYLPESVTTIRQDAFCTKEGVELFVALPSSLKSVSLGAFWCDADNLINVLTACKKIADSLGEDRRANCIYTGGPLDDLSPRAKPYAVQGFLYAERQMPDVIKEWRSSYLNHIKRNEQTYIKKAAIDDFLLMLMLNEELLSRNGVSYLLEKLPKKKHAEMIAALLAYQEMQFSKDNPEKDFSLSDSDPKMRRALDMTARREQLKEQKGIRGIAFVSTGALKQFGKYNEYIDVYDMNDLKAYIEARGGFYRSAVSSKTDYLICNDPNSNSAKSQKAKEFGVPVITEEEFLRMAEETE